MNLLALLFLLAAAIWAIPLLSRGRLSRLVAVLFLVGTVFGPPFFAVDGPFQISIDRVLLAGLVGVAAVQWRLGKVQLPTMLRIDFCVVLLTCYLFLRSQGGDPLESQGDPISRWLFYVFVPLLGYALCRVAPFRRRDFYWMLTALVVLGIYLSFTAVCEVLGFHALVFPKFILDPNEWMFFGRGRGPLLNPIGNGFLIGVAMSAVAACFVGSSRDTKAMLLAVAIILLLGGYATLTRSCWIGVIAPVVAVVLIHCPRWVRILGLASAVLLAAALVTGVKDELLSLKRDKALSASEAAKSVELRPLLAAVSWEMFKDKPIAGHGFGQFLQHQDPYHTVRDHHLPLEQVRGYSHHNVFLAFLVDAGMIGLGLYVALLVILASQSWSLATDAKPLRDRRRAGMFAIGVFACYLPNAMFHDLTVIPMVQLVLMGLAGMVVSIYENGFALEGEPVEARELNRRSTLRVGSS